MEGLTRGLWCALVLGAVSALDTSRRSEPGKSAPASFCESETFHAKCFSNEVISMTSAMYGRMRIGRCVESDLGYLGCSSDILDLADRKCSGKKTCEIRIPDGDLDKVNTCYKELKVYLEASYRCVRALSSDYGGCTTPIPVTQEEGHLLIDPANTSSLCRAFTFEAQEGQRINLTLVDFSWISSKETGTDMIQMTRNCLNYGDLFDKRGHKNMTICGGGDRRVKHLMLSDNSTVEMRLSGLMGSSSAAGGRRFLIRYRAVGCPDLRRPKDAWLKRNQSDATVGCVATRQTWHLKCDGKAWVGVIGNCTKHLLTARKEAQIGAYTTYIPHSVAIVLIVGIAIVICVVIVSVGFIVIRRYNQKLCGKRQGQVRYDNVRTEDDVYKTRKDDVMTISQKTAQTVPTPQTKSPYHKKNDYSHIWEFPLPDPKQDRSFSEGPYRGVRSGNTDSAYGTSLLSTRPGTEENYHVSMASRATDDSSRYFVLDRDPVAPIPDDPDC